MKYLHQNPQVKQHLQAWANPLPLVVAHFYFWNAGSDSQKSQDSLIRSLIYRCLKQMPSLVPLAFPKRWAVVKFFGAKPGPDSWSRHELDQAMELIACQNHKRINLVLFINGLDEFDGDHKVLMQQLKSLVIKYRVKLCVSSRPWNVFRGFFGTSSRRILA